jgi:integrating conjugative element protein (TIGR03757 family)
VVGFDRRSETCSEGLSADADTDAAQAEALRRFRSLDAETRHQLAQSATGLARAVRCGLDRCPGIVFDGQAVIYGANGLRQKLLASAAATSADFSDLEVVVAPRSSARSARPQPPARC